MTTPLMRGPKHDWPSVLVSLHATTAPARSMEAAAMLTMLGRTVLLGSGFSQPNLIRVAEVTSNAPSEFGPMSDSGLLTLTSELRALRGRLQERSLLLSSITTVVVGNRHSTTVANWPYWLGRREYGHSANVVGI